MTELTFDNGKYKIILKDDGTYKALRYDEPWPAAEHSHLTASMGQRIAELEAKTVEGAKLHKALVAIASLANAACRKLDTYNISTPIAEVEWLRQASHPRAA